MTHKKVCIFVDGENLRHSIMDLFPSFKNYDYLPKGAKWTKFFDWITSLVAEEKAERIRTYWYSVKSIDFSPYISNNIKQKPEVLKKILSRDKKMEEKLCKIDNPDELIKFMEKELSNLLITQEKMNKRFFGWISIQNSIEEHGKSIEFRRAGYINYNLFNGRFGLEKAVDVKLATDLIRLKDIYDIAVIVSGDQDYVPAVDAIKDAGKHTVNVAFLTEEGRLLPGGAKRLNQSTDWSIKIGHEDFKKYLGL